jgi:AcrR family transcriptional regulator
MAEARKSSQDWIVAGFRALAVAGPQAVRAERLARDLGVSKGSFYWHFADVAALRDAMLAHWVDAATAQPIAQADAAGPDPMARLHSLIISLSADLAGPYGGPGAETGLRAWGRSDAVVAAAVAAVDARRLGWLMGNLADAKAEQPDLAARLFYACHDLPALLARLLPYSSATVSGSAGVASDRSP